MTVEDTYATDLKEYNESADTRLSSTKSDHSRARLQDACKSLQSDAESKDLRYVSGKWFVKTNVEIPDITDHIRRLIQKHPNTALGKYCTSKARINEVIAQVIATESDEMKRSKWPDPPALAHAKMRIKAGKSLTLQDVQSIYPVDEGILRLLNIMLFHPDEAPIIIVHGKRQTGKSTQFRLVKQMFNNDFGSVSLSQLESRFGLVDVVKHRLVGGDELPSGTIKMTENLKRLQSHDEVCLEKKGVDPITVKTQTMLFYCTNNVPNFEVNLSMDGIQRRIVYYVLKQHHDIDCELERRVLTRDELSDIAIAAYSYEKDYPNWKSWFMRDTNRYLLKPKTSYQFFEHRDEFLAMSYTAKLLPLYEQYRLYCRDYEYIKPQYISKRSTFESECELLLDWGIIDSNYTFIPYECS